VTDSPSFSTKPTRRAAVVGTWYPADPDALAQQVDAYLDAVDVVSRADVTALIAPHAGLVYSGPVGAYAYQAVRGRSYDVALLVGPSHFVGFEGMSIYPRGAFATPLGPAVVHAAIAEQLLSGSDLMIEYPRAHEHEHSLGMQLSFLRRVLPDTPIVPLVMGVQSRATSVGLAEDLARTLAGTRALLVGSTDLSHYFDAERAARLDSRGVDHVDGFDWEGLLAEMERYPQPGQGRWSRPSERWPLPRSPKIHASLRLSVEELQQFVIEVSVLGPLEPCSGLEAVEIGRHGLVIDDDPRRGLLLPQVAVERSWDPHTFVSKTCAKAGLRPDAWTHTATLSMFEADVFSEVDAAASNSEGP